MLKQLQAHNVSFYEAVVGLRHFCHLGAPNAWSDRQGATHTLHTLDGFRPAQVFKTFALIGVDEDEYGDIVWERWQISKVEKHWGTEAETGYVREAGTGYQQLESEWAKSKRLDKEMNDKYEKIHQERDRRYLEKTA
tara:strand:- start:2628 stop:3038 length:411 start_codon:yes stop_codon:yes gene_type:complete